MQHKRVGIILSVAGALLVAALTLVPGHGAAVAGSVWCLVCGDYGGQDFVTNVLLTLPLAAGLRLAGVRRGHVIIAVAASSLAIELLQFKVIPGRDASVGDVAANTLGGIMGAQLAQSLPGWLHAPPAAARRLAALAAAAWLAFQVAASALVRPSPLRGTYWGQWTPWPVAGGFSGTTISVSLNGAPVPIGPFRAGALWRDTLHGRGAQLDAVVVADGPAPSAVQIAGVATTYTRMLALDQRGRHLLLRVPTRAEDVRMRSPAVVLENVFPAEPGPTPRGARRAEEMRIAGGIVRGRLVLSAQSAARSARLELPLRPSLVWSVLLPDGVALGRGTELLAALWAAALLAPLGYSSARASIAVIGAGPRLRAHGAALLVATIGVGVAVIPAVFGLPPAPVIEWCGTIAGLALGWYGARRAALAQRAHRTTQGSPGTGR